MPPWNLKKLLIGTRKSSRDLGIGSFQPLNMQYSFWVRSTHLWRLVEAVPERKVPKN